MFPYPSPLLGVSGGSGVVTPSTRLFGTGAFATPTTNSTVDYTDATFSGNTPKAALTLLSRHTSGSTETDYAGWDIGMMAAAGNKCNAGFFCATGVTTGGTTGGRFGHQTNTVLNLVNSGAGTLVLAGCSLITNGIEAVYTTATSARQAGFMGFAGSDISGYSNALNLGTGTTAIVVSTVGFQPDAIITMGDTAIMNGLAASTGLFFGFATSDGTQRCVTWKELTTVASAPFMSILTDCCAAEITDGGGSLIYKVVASAFNSSGFSLTPSASTASDRLGYLALKSTGGGAKIVDFTTATSTGVQTISGAGFTPSAAIIVLTALEALDATPGATSATQGGLSITLVSDTVFSASARIRSGVGTQETRSLALAGYILGASDTACDALKGTFDSWTSDGMTINWSAVLGTGKKGFILFLR